MNNMDYEELRKSLDESERELYQKIAAECSGYFEDSMQENIKGISEIINEGKGVIEQIQGCQTEINAVSDSADALIQKIVDSEKQVEQVRKAFNDLSNIIDKKEKQLNSSIELFDKTLNEQTYIMKKTVESFSCNITENEKKIQEFSLTLQNADDRLQIADETFTKAAERWTDDYEMFKEKLEKNANEIDKSIKDLVDKLNGSVEEINQYTNKYSDLLKEVDTSINTKIEGVIKDILCIKEKQESVLDRLGNEELKSKKRFLISSVALGVIILVQILSFIV